MIAPGDAVLTKFGAGVVIRCFDAIEDSPLSTRQRLQPRQAGYDGSTEQQPTWTSVRLWRQPGRSVASCAMATLRVEECISRKLAAAPGMIVRVSTSTSVSEVAASDDNGRDGNNYQKEEDDEEKMYLIERYLPFKDIFLASSIKNNTNEEAEAEGENNNKHAMARSLAVMSNINCCGGQSASAMLTATAMASQSTKKYYQLHPCQISACSTSAKFYPVLESLMIRGEAAWNVALARPNEHSPHFSENISSVNKIFSPKVTATSSSDENGSSGNVAKILVDVSKSSMETINKKLDGTTLENGHDDSYDHVTNISAKQALNMAAKKATAASQAVTRGLSLPQTEEIKQVYEMLRDDDLTQLFLKGRVRLKELVEAEIPSRTKNALAAVGIELEDYALENRDVAQDMKKSMRGGMDRLRKEALTSLDQILKMNVSEDGKIDLQTDNNGGSISIHTMGTLNTPFLLMSTLQEKEETYHQFGAMFDHLSRVATSDQQLLQIFNGISERTKSWQEMTGRLLETKTASLFFEGSQRLRARAAELLNVAPGQLRNTFGGGDASRDLTRAFTEGEIAMAKLKSVEMGDALRKRVFAAIELRSESSGGLDAIIAGSLAAIQCKGDGYSSKTAGLLGKSGLEDVTLSSPLGRATYLGGNGISEATIQPIITKLQQSATTSMNDAKETLIALLSRRSSHQDAVLLRLERVFLDLDSKLAISMSAEEITKLANGEGGTLALFQPVATKAAKEIETHLDMAERKMKESKHWNSKADNVMLQVRKITQGELSMADILDMAAGYLDDEDVASRSGGLIVKAESMLDNFEAASARIGEGSQSIGPGASGAGIMGAVAKAGITKDSVMKGVGSLDVDRLLDNTQSAMTDEKARQELISSAGDTALDFLLRILPSMPVPPFDGVRDGLVYHLSNLSMAGFKVKKENIYIEIAGIHAATQKADRGAIPQSSKSGTIKASELLIIDIKNISATLDDAVWSFEQTYMPYLKGSGKANTKLWDGAIRLKFELRRHLNDQNEWEPVLCLNDRRCSIGGVELIVQGEGRITWVANKLASLLKNPLRDYVVNVIVNTLKNNSGWLIDMFNQNLSNYWDFIMRTANLDLDNLPKLARHHVTKAEIDNAQDEVELVWRERVPLGLNIITNDTSGFLKVIDLPRGTQARKVAHSRQLDPEIFKGATIVSVNGKRYGSENQRDLFMALKDPARPKAILFKLASSEDAKRIVKVFDGGKKNAALTEKETSKDTNLVTSVYIAEAGDLGLKFVTQDNFALAVNDFPRDATGGQGVAEKTGKVARYDLLSHVNGELVLGEGGAGPRRALRLLERDGAARPLSLGFVKPYMYDIVFENNAEEGGKSLGGPSELVFINGKKSMANESKIMFEGFAPTEGAAERGGVFVGDNLAFVNGIPVGAGLRLLTSSGPSPKLDEVIRMLNHYKPLALTFARAQAKQISKVKAYLTSSPLSLDIGSAYTFSIPAVDYNQLGCKFVTGMNGSDIVVKEIGGVEGPFQQQMKALKRPFIGCRVVSVDGEVIPSYVNSQLIANAIKRRWASNGRVELRFCNEMQKDALCEVRSWDDT